METVIATTQSSHITNLLTRRFTLSLPRSTRRSYKGAYKEGVFGSVLTFDYTIELTTPFPTFQEQRLPDAAETPKDRPDAHDAAARRQDARLKLRSHCPDADAPAANAEGRMRVLVSRPDASRAVRPGEEKKGYIPFYRSSGALQRGAFGGHGVSPEPTDVPPLNYQASTPATLGFAMPDLHLETSFRLICRSGMSHATQRRAIPRRCTS